MLPFPFAKTEQFVDRCGILVVAGETAVSNKTKL